MHGRIPAACGLPSSFSIVWPSKPEKKSPHSTKMDEIEGTLQIEKWPTSIPDFDLHRLSLTIGNPCCSSAETGVFLPQHRGGSSCRVDLPSGEIPLYAHVSFTVLIRLKPDSPSVPKHNRNAENTTAFLGSSLDCNAATLCPVAGTAMNSFAEESARSFMNKHLGGRIPHITGQRLCP